MRRRRERRATVRERKGSSPASNIASDAETDHWEVRSKDGLVSVYGTPRSIQNDPAVIANPENRSQIFNWKLTETEDPFGNTIRYDYERDLGDTADHLWDQLYLKRIRYVDYTDPQARRREIPGLGHVQL